MSFGFGIGDFLAVIQLTNSIRKSIKSAPRDFNELSIQVNNLSLTLQDLEFVVAEREPTPREKEELDGISNSCRGVLEDLGKFLDRSQVLGSDSKTPGDRFKRAWKKTTWDIEEIDKFRMRIISNIGFLNAFSGKFERDQIAEVLQHQKEQRHTQVLDWLTPVDYAVQHSDLSGCRLVGSGQLFLDSEKFKRWLGKGGQTLFCTGVFGAGKTMLTSAVIDHLFETYAGDEKVGIAYIYCDHYIPNSEKSVSDLLACLLKQLAQGQSALSSSVQSIYNNHADKRTRPLLDQLSEALRSTAAGFSRVFIIVDALDEFPPSYRDKFKSQIFALQHTCQGNVYMTSRTNQDLEGFLGKDTVEICANDDDMVLYINAQMQSLPRFIRTHPTLPDLIKTTITKSARGMFLFAQRMLEFLDDKLTISDVESALEKFASRDDNSDLLELLYGDTMSRIETQKQGFQRLAKQVLSWISHAKSQLTISELQHALSVRPGSSNFNEKDLPHMEDMISACQGLVTVDIQSGLIGPAHNTVQEFIRRHYSANFHSTETAIAKACASYLSFGDFSNGFCKTDDEFKTRLETYPFYDYAARNWGHHAREVFMPDGAADGAEKGLTEHLVQSILAPGNDAVLAGSVQAMMIFQRYTNFSQDVPQKMTGLHLASYFELHPAVIELFKGSPKPELEAKDSYGRTPLSWAAQRGNETVVEWLLKQGANANTEATATFMDKCTPLWFAAQNGHEGVVVQLLKVEGIAADAKIIGGQTPLSRAARNGHVAVVKHLVDRADVNSKDDGGRTPLSWAAANGHDKVVEVLLNRGADINSRDGNDGNGRTPLNFAVENGRRAVVENLVMKNGVEIDGCDLVCANNKGYDAILQFLKKAKHFGSGDQQVISS